MDNFVSDVRRYGGPVALRRHELRRRAKEFRARQVELVFLSALLLLAFALSGLGLFALLALFAMQAGAVEARRMSRTGRYWQTKRSLELMGE